MMWLVILLLQAAPAPAPAATCKKYNDSKCCDAKVTAHLGKEAVFAACGQSDATFLGEKAEKDTCNYYFKVGSEPPAMTYVQVYAPPMQTVPTAPNDPFFTWKKIGKVFVVDKAKSPKAAPIMVNSTGLWLPGKGYFVSVNASTKVCTKQEAAKLAPSMK